MQPSTRRGLRNLLLSSIYSLGILGILASGGDGDNDVVRDFTCGLSVRGIAPVGDGTVWIGVFAKTDSDTEDRVVLLDTDGSELLSYFIGDGGTENAVRAVARDAFGNVYVGGDFSGGILRLDAFGVLDNSFPAGTGFDDRVTSIVPLSDGKIYVGGSFDDYDGDLVSGFVRLENNGMLDPGFGGNGATVDSVESIAMSGPNPTDNVYSGGEVVPLIERWDNNGMDIFGYDPAIGGSVLNISAADLLGVNTGDIYLGGTFGGRIIRLNSDGSVDGVFSIGAGFDADVTSIALGTMEDIYVGGEFTTYDGISANGIVRLNDDGSRDLGFIIGNGFADPDGVFPVLVANVAQDPSLDVFVGGGFTQYDGTDTNGIVRLDPDGSIDAGFDVSINIDGEVCNSQTIPDS